MIWIIIGLVISFFIWQRLIHEKATKISFGECLFTIAISSVVIIIVSTIPTIYVDYTDIKYSYNDLESSTKIIALKDNNRTEGQFSWDVVLLTIVIIIAIIQKQMTEILNIIKYLLMIMLSLDIVQIKNSQKLIYIMRLHRPSLLRNLTF